MNIPLLNDIVAVFGLSIVVLLVCHRMRLPAIVGLLITGVLCGPSAMGLVRDIHAVELLAEIGVVLLLFTIGMELSGEELMRLRKPVFIGGFTQVALTVAVFAVMYVVISGKTWPQGFFYGCLTALSSTAIVLSILQLRAESEAPHGRLALSVLVFQDLAIVPMVLAVPLLAGTTQADGLSLALSAGRGAAILGGGWLFARYVVPRLMRYVVNTRSRELLVMSTLALCLAIALGTAYLGLSLSLGAFLAGLLLAESEYSLSVVEGILPFKDVFTSLFFISVGMLLDVNYFFTHTGEVLFWAVAVILLKSLLTIPAILLLGYPLRIAVTTSVSLAQIGEFAFVLAGAGLAAGLIDAENYQLFLAGSILTMTLTPLMMSRAAPIANCISSRLTRGKAPVESYTQAEDHGRRNHLIIVGFGVGGKHLARTAKDAGIEYAIVEMNPDTVSRFRDIEPIMHGDASKPLILEHLDVRTARVLSIVISDPAAVRAVTAVARSLNPTLHIVVRTRFLNDVDDLQALGADDVIAEEFETSIEVFTRVLNHYLIPRQQIDRFVAAIRSENYAMSRGLSLPAANLTSLLSASQTAVDVAVISLEHGALIEGQTLIEADLRRKYEVTVVAIKREGGTIISPQGDTQLLAGDQVYVFGATKDLGDVLLAFTNLDKA